MATDLTGHPSAGVTYETYDGKTTKDIADEAAAAVDDSNRDKYDRGFDTVETMTGAYYPTGYYDEKDSVGAYEIVKSLWNQTEYGMNGKVRDNYLELMKNGLPPGKTVKDMVSAAKEKYHIDNEAIGINSRGDPRNGDTGGVEFPPGSGNYISTDDNKIIKGNSGNNSGNNFVTRTDSEGNTREVGRYTNTTPQRGSNTAVYGDDYLKAIPDSYKINNLYKQILGREVGSAGLGYYGPKFADGSMTELQLKESLLASNEYKNSGGSVSAPLSAPITSPSASNSVATSYGNSNNAGRQWASGVFANNNGGGYTGGGVDVGGSTTLNGLYQEVFGRDVGPDGIAAYQSALDNKTMAPEQVRDILMSSAEKTNQLATGNTAAVITAPLDGNDSVSLSTNTDDANTAALKARMNQSYIDNFGRPIGDAGMDHYLPMLQSGMHTNGQAVDESWFNKHLATTNEAKTYAPLGGFAETGMLSTNLGYTPVNAMTTAAAAATTAGAA